MAKTKLFIKWEKERWKEKPSEKINFFSRMMLLTNHDATPGVVT